MQVTIAPLDAAQAREMISWCYDAPYDMYNLSSDNLEDEVQYLINPDSYYFSIVDENQDFIGYCCYFKEGQVPGGDYSQAAVDVGMGMRPDWTGKGTGTRIAQAVMTYAVEQYKPTRLRATIAAWNERAQKVCLNNGFELVDRFTNPKTYRDYVILVRTLT